MADDLSGEVMEFDDEDSDVIDTPDGGARVLFEELESPEEDGEFYANLAETMPEGELNALALTMIELIERDKEARSKRDKQYEEGIRRTGLGDDAPGGAQFEGASRVVHPMLTKGCVDFASRTIKELFPPDGPVKTKIFGVPTKQRSKKADRKTALMNWQLTQQAKEFRGELEQLLTQVPLGGAQFLKITWDSARNRPKFLFIAIDDIYLPYAATNFYSANRRTEVQYLTQVDFEARVKSGMYRDVDLMPPGMEPDPSKTQQANDKIEGKESTSYNEDGLRTIFEITGIMDLEDDVGNAPYILTIDKVSHKVLGLYRNWDEDDETLEELMWIVEFPFVPWRGAYPIGLPHMIGGLSAATTGALRALLDSAHISNSQAMVKLKGGSRGGQTLEIQPTQIQEIEGGIGVDDIRKLAMPLPFNQPSAVLLQLMTILVQEADSVLRTTLDDKEPTQNTPVGTQLARIEQAMVVFSAVHQRLHAAMARVFDVLGRLNGKNLDDEKLAKEVGDDLASRADFTGPLDCVPVSDPNIFSEAQRFAQVQAVAQRSALVPQLYDARKVELRILGTLKIPDPEDLLMPAQTPMEENAIKENVKASLGQPVIAMPDQDHVAHLKTHVGFMLSPTLGMNPLIAPQALPTLLGHLKEHIVLWYAQQTFQQAEEAVVKSGGKAGDLSDMMDDTKDKDDKQALDRMIAEASLNAVVQAEEAFVQLIQDVIPKIQEIVKQFTPPMPMDGAVQVAMEDVKMRERLGMAKIKADGEQADKKGQLEVGKLQVGEQTKAAETERQTQADAERANLDHQRELQEAEIEAQAEERREQAEIDRLRIQDRLDVTREVLDRSAEEREAEADRKSKEAMNHEDNVTAIKIAEIGAKSRPKTDNNPNPGKNPNSNPNPNKNP